MSSKFVIKCVLFVSQANFTLNRTKSKLASVSCCFQFSLHVVCLAFQGFVNADSWDIKRFSAPSCSSPCDVYSSTLWALLGNWFASEMCLFGREGLQASTLPDFS